MVIIELQDKRYLYLHPCFDEAPIKQGTATICVSGLATFTYSSTRGRTKNEELTKKE
jgi:hypothetical protein